MSADLIILLDPSAPGSKELVSGIADIHAACILNDGTLATFLPPLSFDVMYAWWDRQNDQIASGSRATVVCLSPTSTRTRPLDSTYTRPFQSIELPTVSASMCNAADGPTAWSGPFEVSGVVSLDMPASQTGPFRALVQKLFVSPLHRRKGIARRMMARLETEALRRGRWSLMLDTTVGTAAEHVYPALGWERLGVVRNYGISPVDGQLVDEVWYWKDLRPREQGGHGCLAGSREGGAAADVDEKAK